MSKFKIEIQITLIAVIIAAAVVTSGYFAYKSLSKIVYSIHQETGPDYKLFIIKDIAADLAELENNVRLYILTNSKADLVPCDTLQNQITEKLENLKIIIARGGNNVALADSIRELSVKKLELWKGVLALHKSTNNNQPDFSELYSKLEEQKVDTVEVETEKKGFLRKIFGGKKVTVDTTYVEHDVETDQIRQEIQNLESEMIQKGQRVKILESQLIEQNIALGEKMSRFIAEAEKNETDNLIEKTNEADRLARLTYKRLAAFSAAAVTLLLVVVFLLFSYLRKSRAYEQALKKAKAEAEKLAKAKEQFASNVSHEMRTPVNAIYGLAEQLLQEKTNDVAYEQISVIARSASHLKNIINDTLDFSKIQSKNLKIDAIHFSPADVFSEIITLQKNEAEKKGVALLYTTEDSLPEALIGDPMRLKQILINLVSNAIKFTDEGEVALRVKPILDRNGFRLQMQVSDSGIGIPKENLGHIFDEFVQIDNQSGKKYSGTGLGLAIVKKLVEMQKGKIVVKSEPEEGTEVTLTIPFRRGKKEKIEETYFITSQVPSYFKKLSVLVADDEEFNRFLMKAIFQKWGTRYKEVTNGIDAVEVASKEHFDLILMDVRMPGLSGMEATKAILENDPETTIIAVTATNEQFDQDTCIKAGMKGFLLKPFSEKELVDKIKSALKTKPAKIDRNVSSKVNLQEARRFANGDEAFLKEMTALFIKTTGAGLKEIQIAANNENREIIAETSHKMAAPCKHFLANDLYKTIKRLEDEANNNSNWNTLKNQILILESEIKDVNDYLTEHFNLK
jgi:signal transduction histidine kinase/DNA-binding response OmpR family regulator